MDQQRWIQMCEKARQEEIAIRRTNIDPNRAPLPAAINTRLMYNLFGRMEELEKEMIELRKAAGIKATKKDENRCECGREFSYEMDGGVTIGCLPQHCAIAEGRRTPEDAKKDDLRKAEIRKRQEEESRKAARAS
jgi:hypothetical protein